MHAMKEEDDVIDLCEIDPAIFTDSTDHHTTTTRKSNGASAALVDNPKPKQSESKQIHTVSSGGYEDEWFADSIYSYDDGDDDFDAGKSFNKNLLTFATYTLILLLQMC